MTRRLVNWAIVAVLGIPAWPALAQCMGRAGGQSHEHGGETVTKREQESERMLHALLSEERNRGLLMEAILADPEFMRALVERIVEIPEWRALTAERIGVSVQPPADSREGAEVKGDQTLYACPMHPEVTSDKPGRCSKCGMTLQRKGS